MSDMVGDQTSDTVKRGEKVNVPCGYCAGTGGDKIGNCPACKGRGWGKVTSPAIRCEACRGTGHKHSTSLTCTVCNGLGWVQAPPTLVTDSEVRERGTGSAYRRASSGGSGRRGRKSTFTLEY